MKDYTLNFTNKCTSKRMKMTEKKFPCWNCITLAICKSMYLDNSVAGTNRIVSKCSLIRDYITEESFVIAKDGSSTGMVKTDRLCLLNFKTFMDGTLYG